MESVQKTINNFNKTSKSTYNLNEVRELLEVRENLYEKESSKFQAIIAILIAVCFFLSFFVVMLW